MNTRFYAYVHAIMGEQMLIKPRHDSVMFSKANIHDFESIIMSPTQPNDQTLFVFDVKPTRSAIWHEWLEQPKKAEKTVQNPDIFRQFVGEENEDA